MGFEDHGIELKENPEKDVASANIDFVALQFLSGFLPPPDMDIPEWADKYRILPKSSASEHGQWRNSRTPYLVEIMHELSPQSMAEEVAFMKPVQVGGTELLINFVLYSIMYDPCPIGVFEPDEMLTRKLMNRINAAAKEMGIDKYFQDSTMYEKSFPGGQLYAGWSSSESHLRSAPMKKVAGDEVGSWVEDCEGFGDPTDLMRDRTTTFAQKKVFTCSTPGVNIPEKHVMCRMYARFVAGDQRVYKVPCPHCGVLHELKWDNMRWDKDENGKDLEETAHMVCPECGESFSESYKNEILQLGQWEATNPEGKFPSFRLNALYSPLGWCSWRKMVHVFIEARDSKNKAKMRVFVNNYLGEPWMEQEEETIDETPLEMRKEDYGAEIPDGVVVLTAAWDTQDNRIECEVRGWGKNFENWAIDKKVFVGDPNTDMSVWSRLDNYLMRPFHKADGSSMYVCCTLGDSGGHCTEMVYSFTGPRKSRRIFACKGRDGRGYPIAMLPKSTDKSAKYGAQVVEVGVDTIKDLFFSWAKVEKPGSVGYMHFPNLPEYNHEHFLQLASEKLVMKVKDGKVKHKYVKTRDRNEALDLFNYNRAALALMRIDLNTINAVSDAGRVVNFNPVTAQHPQPSGRRTLSKGVSV